MFNITDGRIYMNDDAGKMIAEVTFTELDDNTILVNHTFVDYVGVLKEERQVSLCWRS